MIEIMTLYGTPIEDVPEPLRSALQERMPTVMAWMRDGVHDPLLMYDHALIERFEHWRLEQRRRHG